MLTPTESVAYGRGLRRYTEAVDSWTVGDVIRKARIDRRWNQQRLGEEAAKFPLGDQVKAIDKGTVSKVERDPYGSKFGTVWRLLAALELSLGDAEQKIGLLRRQEGHKRRTHTVEGQR